MPRTVDNNPGIPSRVLMSYFSWSIEKVLGLAIAGAGAGQSLYNATLPAEI